jgi:uncharacterized damage-inducible protein DinB
MNERVEGLVARLRKGIEKTAAIFGALGPTQWEVVVYPGPPAWTVRDLLAHFLSAEEGLLGLVQEIAAGGRGAPPDFDYNAYNAQEQERLAGIPPQQLLADLQAARERTIAWVEGLSEAELERRGFHPALGEVTVEEFITAIYGHQLMHMRELASHLG